MASILEALGPPSPSQVGPKSTVQFSPSQFGSQLAMPGRFENDLGKVWGVSGQDFGRVQDGYGTIWHGFQGDVQQV